MVTATVSVPAWKAGSNFIWISYPLEFKKTECVHIGFWLVTLSVHTPKSKSVVHFNSCYLISLSDSFFLVSLQQQLSASLLFVLTSGGFIWHFPTLCPHRNLQSGSQMENQSLRILSPGEMTITIVHFPTLLFNWTAWFSNYKYRQPAFHMFVAKSCEHISSHSMSACPL